jgi:hypothetical protein
MTGVAKRPAPSPRVRDALRELLSAGDEFRRLDPETRRAIANGLVRICDTGHALAVESATAGDVARRAAAPARAMSAGSEFSGVAAQRVAGTTREILNAVSFPRFVTDLINGVFKAILDSNQQQLDSYVDLIRNVAATTEGFAGANVGLDGARRWLAERFPASFEVTGGEPPSGGARKPEDDWAGDDQDSGARLRLRAGASMPGEAALRTALGIGEKDPVPTGDPERLVPVAQASLARNRQQMLGTLLMLGMQRIVIESGRLHAAMRFHIDTRSAAAEDRGSRFDMQNKVDASARFGLGPWGASANIQNTIGYVSTQRTQTTEEMNTDLELNSGVELVFRTDYLPLDRLAGKGTADRIRVNTLNPDEENRRALEARTERQKSQRDAEQKRGAKLESELTPRPAPPTPPPPPTPPSPPPKKDDQSTPPSKDPTKPAPPTENKPAPGPTPKTEDRKPDTPNPPTGK